MEFPHLNDTNFPNFNNVNVYAFRNEFDYTRWGENTRIRLVNVLWDSNYNDVVKFENDEERDEWFDSLEDKYDVTLNTFIRIVPDGTIKLPIPYDVLSRYNYCYVDIPIATSEDHPIDYENDWGYRRWYFFINDCNYHAPNTTLISVGIDIWTQFVNEMKFKYLMLERGHAPVAYTNVEDYLSNPYKHSEYLLAPDVNYDNAGIVRSANYIPIGNDEKYVCFASVCGVDKFDTLGRVTANANYNNTKPTYSNTGDRWGYQYKVNNYGIGTGYDYSTARTAVSVGNSIDNRIANNTTVYAVPSKDVYGKGTFFNDVMRICPQFFNTVVACFVVPKSLLTLGEKKNLVGHDMYVCSGNSTSLFKDFTFSKSDFKFPERYAHYAKLYTHPYSVIEITDNEGSSREVKIEETSKLSLNLISSVAFPFINIRAFFDGIGGQGSQSYKWIDLAGNITDETISNSRWYEWCIDWNIPTFTLYMDGETSYQLTNFNRQIKNPRESALVAYENAARSANTSYENSVADSNTANTNAHASNDTALANANRSADANKANIDAAANTQISNQTRSNNANRSNADIVITRNTANTSESNATAADKKDANIGLNNALHLVDSLASTATANIDAERADIAAGNATVGGVGQQAAGLAASIAGGAAAGSIIPGIGTAAGATYGAVLGLVGVATSTQVAVSNGYAAINANQATVSALNAANGYRNNAQNAYLSTVQGYEAALQTYVTNQNNAALDAQTDINNACAANNTNASASTSKSNALRTQTAEKTNANANNTTGNANADRTKTNSQANAGYSREAAILNAKNSLEQQRNNALNALADAKNATPKAIGATTGNAANDYFKNKGIQIKIRTQSDSAIAMTGDTFARYGYMLNQVWNMDSGFNLMKNFTYWKAQDVWIDDVNASNTIAQNSITSILNTGVTVWSNPEKIGKVSIYDN